MRTTPLEIPVINFEPFLQGDAAVRQFVAEQIRQAFHEVGFIYLQNPGISSELIEQVFTQSQQFFALPAAVKNQVAWSSNLSNRGYVGVERERLDPSKPGDLKEAFNVGNEGSPGNGDQDKVSSAVLNQWLPEQQEFRSIVLAFYSACVESANHILCAFAISLGLPESFFTDRHNQQNNILRLLHYPPLNQAPKAGQVRAGEHSDYGSITLLFQDAIGGLEVKTVEGEWVAAPHIPGTVVVNTGDLMQRWTNHEICSTKHRVMIPAHEKQGISRYSIAFFCDPNPDVEITCIESCQGRDRPALYPPILAGDYLLSRLQATY